MYTNSFGGTSSACPGAAGVAALVLAVNPALKWHEVRDILRRACDRIDPVDGGYDAGGRSPKYGHGRLNARTAVELAKPQPRSEVTVTRRFDAPLPDLQTAEFGLEVAERGPVEAVSVGVEIRHTYVGDLQVTLKPPAATRVGAIVLHDRAGGARNDLKKVYDATDAPRLGDLAGRTCAGTWTLRVRDCEALDTGTLVSFSVRLKLGQGAPRPAKKARSRRRPVAGPRQG
jgi:subtilisin-like proprotein convertase family protein